MLRTANGNTDFCSKRVGGRTPLANTPVANAKPNRWISNNWFAKGSSVPQGFNSERAITMPLVSGGNIACLMVGSADITAGLLGKGNLSATLQGDSTITAGANLASNMTCVLQGDSLVTASPSAKGNLSATLDAGERPSAFDIAQEIWQSKKSVYNAPGTMGNALNSAGSSGDPWSTDLSTYPPGTAGYIVYSLDPQVLAEAIMTDPRLLTVAKFLGLK